MTAATARSSAGKPAWLVLAGVELRLIARNKLIATTSMVVPLGMVGFIMLVNPGLGAGMSALNLMMLMAITVYMTTTLTLVHRRTSLYLKRIRSSPVSTPGILAGIVAAPAVLFVGQCLLLFVGQALLLDVVPARPAILAVAVAVGVVTSAALAFLTAAFTRTPEAAQVTTTPGFLVFFGGTVLANMVPPGTIDWLVLAVPGGGIAQLARYGFGEPGMDVMAGVVAPSVASSVVALVCCVIAARLFTWEPRS